MEKVRKKSYEIPCKLTDKEKKDMGHEVASLQQFMEQLKLNKKAAMADYDNKIKTAEARMSEVSQQIVSGIVLRTIECEVVYNKPKVNYKTITRTDTGEHWEEVMEESEKQEEFGF